MWIYIILVVICVVSFMFRVAYVAQTKELSVKYAKIVLQKYKDSRSKTLISVQEYLENAILAETPLMGTKQFIKLKNRILNNWLKCFSKAELASIAGEFAYSRNRIIKSHREWFPNNNDKNTRIYFLKKVISRNSK